MSKLIEPSIARRIQASLAKEILDTILDGTDVEVVGSGEEILFDGLAFDGMEMGVNGYQPWHIQVNDPSAYARVLTGGSLTLGETYMEGLWDSVDLSGTLTRLLSARLDEKVPSLARLGLKARARLLNLQDKRRSKQAVSHYDLSNLFYQLLLDPHMQYTCGYWKDAKTLEEAQEAKLELICKKLKLKAGDRVLELGGGWGGLAEYAARKYGCKVVSYNIAHEQVSHARERCKGLDVEIIEGDYREAIDYVKAHGRFDKIVTVGLFCHVGYKNHRTFMEVADKCLKEDGLFLLHCIGKYDSVQHTDPWLQKYIFPNAVIASAEQITTAAEGLFTIEDWHNFGHDYDKTTMAWYQNFVKNWNIIKELDCVKQSFNGDTEKFKRMWCYYLSSAAASFRSERNHLFQVVFSKGTLNEQYGVVR